jgi:predicted DCC family thiol-disulfide oxidoreductase YuxK
MSAAHAEPILLYNGECAVCRRIAAWVATSAHDAAGARTLAERPIGDDPAALRALVPGLDIWDAYETIHFVMPDGSLARGGEAVAEVLRRCPNCRWFAWTFAVGAFGFRPFQLVLDLGYTILSDARPLLGCESCGIPSPWVRAVRAIVRARTSPVARPHFTTAAKPRA